MISQAGEMEYNPKLKISNLLIVALGGVIAISATVSYIGGNSFVVKNATPPTLSANAKIDSLKLLVAEQKTLAESYRNTTWKNIITQDAAKGLNKAQDEQTRLNILISKEQLKDDSALNAALLEHDNKTINFGYVMGGVAVFADIVLLFVLFTISRLESEVAAVSTELLGGAVFRQLTPEYAGQATANLSAAQSISAVYPVAGQAPTTAQYGDQTPDDARRYPTPEENKAAPVGSVLFCPVDGVEFVKTVHNKKFCCTDCKRDYANNTGRVLIAV